MGVLLRKGAWLARFAEGPGDMAAIEDLRAQCFWPGAPTSDAFDARCQHVVVETAGGDIVCCFRILHLGERGIGQSYSAQYYDLSALTAFSGALIELGRFCVAPGYAHNPDILRMAWGALTHIVDQAGARLLFGCSSYQGTDADRFVDSFAWLRGKYLAPKQWMPGVKSPDIVHLTECAGAGVSQPKNALRQTPPLLRTYLAMGGWVSDHAVVDTQMNTLHVFTGVEIDAIPAARKKILRAYVP